MNLIEKLGGYDYLKKEYEETLPMIQKGYKSKGMEVIRLLLLEYRRENNIFELGDLVVLTSTGTKGVLLEIIDHKYTNDLHRVKIVKLGSCGPIHKDQIRHATPKEIKAGHRL